MPPLIRFLVSGKEKKKKRKEETGVNNRYVSLP
jgi:hypothetical protein